jgi:hypothetical protein
MLPRVRMVSEVRTGPASGPWTGPSYSKTPVPSGHHDMWPSDLGQRGDPPPPSSRASGRRSGSTLVRAASWPTWRSLWLGQYICQPPLTVSTTVVSADAIMYHSQFDNMPSGPPSRATSDQRSPALSRGARPLACKIRTGCPAPSVAWAGRFRWSTEIRRDPGSLVSTVGVTYPAARTPQLPP